MLPTQAIDHHEKSADQAYFLLRQMIVSLKLEPGSFVDEKSLSTQLGIGRTPVREALLRLADQRLVEIMPRKGTLVTPIRLQDMRSVEEVRWHFESLATRWAAERISPEDLREMECLIDDAETGAFVGIPDWDVEVDRSFHLLLARAAKNPFLAEPLARLYDHSVRLLYATRTTMAPAIEELPEYRQILEAIAAGSPDDAEAAMRRHLVSSRQQAASGFGWNLSGEQMATRQ